MYGLHTLVLLCVIDLVSALPPGSQHTPELGSLSGAETASLPVWCHRLPVGPLKSLLSRLVHWWLQVAKDHSPRG